MTEETLQTLKIHKLTQSQYDAQLEQGNIDETALYLTPYEEVNLTPYVTKDSILDMIYPVGSIYMSVTYTNPSILFGGTWVRIEDTFLLASGSKFQAGSTGGEAEHTLTIDEMPKHNHDVLRPRWFASESGIQEGTNSIYGTESVVTDAFLDSKSIETTGKGNPHNNMPPYLAVYVFKRTS